MKRILLTLLAGLTFATVTTHAQIGWTLEKCRQHFGMEYGKASEARDYHYDFTLYFHAGEYNYNIDFDTDGTVGGMEIIKLNRQAFTETEVQHLLKLASSVN
jgi:hypothetical protein